MLFRSRATVIPHPKPTESQGEAKKWTHARTALTPIKRGREFDAARVSPCHVLSTDAAKNIKYLDWKLVYQLEVAMCEQCLRSTRSLFSAIVSLLLSTFVLEVGRTSEMQ